MADSLILFTILALIVATIQILPKSDIIEMQSYPGKMLKFSLFFFILVIISIMVLGGFFEYVANLEKFVSQDPGTYSQLLNNPIINWTSQINDKPYFSTPSLDFFIQGISVIILLISIFIYFNRKNKISDISKFLEEMDELYLQGNFPIFFKLFESHYDFLMMVQPKKNASTTMRGSICLRIRKLIPSTENGITLEEKMERSHQTNEEINSFIYGKFSDSNFLIKLALIKPYLGVKISFDNKIQWEIRDLMISEFFRNLLMCKESVLHREIRNGTWGRNGYLHRYSSSGENRVLFEIYANLNDIQDLGIIKAFGDTTIELIRQYYNKFHGQERLIGIDNLDARETNPLLSGIQFFDLIVREALYQKIEWHMWLFYYIHFIREICDHFPDLDSEEDYSKNNLLDIRFIDEILFNLLHWIEIAIDEPDKINLEIQSYDCSHENGSIIKSSIICLSNCIDYINRAKKVPDFLKEKYSKEYLRVCFELCKSENKMTKDLASVMTQCLIHERDLERDPEMKQKLHSFIKNFDDVKLWENPDGKQLFDDLLKKTST